MTETLLSLSNILLYGRRVTDLSVVDPNVAATDVTAGSRKNISSLSVSTTKVDGVRLNQNDTVLVKNQTVKTDNGIYTVPASGNWTKTTPSLNAVYHVTDGNRNGDTFWVVASVDGGEIIFQRLGRGGRRRLGQNSFLETQLEDATFARIYGFSYEGVYYDLMTPTLFLVHGDGEPATLPSKITGTSTTEANLARAPRSPTLTGIAAADFEIADDIRIWVYDSADLTIRMDVQTGRFEDVLLSAFFADGGGGGSGLSGARVSGARVSGARVSGARVSGARVSGARLSGGRGEASD